MQETTKQLIISLSLGIILLFVVGGVIVTTINSATIEPDCLNCNPEAIQFLPTPLQLILIFLIVLIITVIIIYLSSHQRFNN
jgi:hypothetical protein